MTVKTETFKFSGSIYLDEVKGKPNTLVIRKGENKKGEILKTYDSFQKLVLQGDDGNNSVSGYVPAGLGTKYDSRKQDQVRSLTIDMGGGNDEVHLRASKNLDRTRGSNKTIRNVNLIKNIPVLDVYGGDGNDRTVIPLDVDGPVRSFGGNQDSSKDTAAQGDLTAFFRPKPGSKFSGAVFSAKKAGSTNKVIVIIDELRQVVPVAEATPKLSPKVADIPDPKNQS